MFRNSISNSINDSIIRLSQVARRPARFLGFAFAIVLLASANVAADSGDRESARGSASSNQGTQLMGAATNAITGAAYYAECASGKTSSCALAALSLVQAMMDMAGAKDSGKTMDAASFDMPEYTPGSYDATTGYGDGGLSGVPSGPGTPLGDYASVNVPAKIAALEDMGYKVDQGAQTVETPDGNVPLAKFGSGGGLSALGLTPKQQADAKALAAKTAGSLVKKYGFSVGSGGGGGGSSARSKYKPYVPGKYSFGNPMAGLLKGLGNRGPASVAGMKRVVGDGESIGVKGDNIFDMVHRQYQQRRGKNHFVEVGDPQE